MAIIGPGESVTIEWTYSKDAGQVMLIVYALDKHRL
jgi:hypothetical protein